MKHCKVTVVGTNWSEYYSSTFVHPYGDGDNIAWNKACLGKKYKAGIDDEGILFHLPSVGAVNCWLNDDLDLLSDRMTCLWIDSENWYGLKKEFNKNVGNALRSGKTCEFTLVDGDESRTIRVEPVKKLPEVLREYGEGMRYPDERYNC